MPRFNHPGSRVGRKMFLEHWQRLDVTARIFCKRKLYQPNDVLDRKRLANRLVIEKEDRHGCGAPLRMMSLV